MLNLTKHSIVMSTLFSRIRPISKEEIHLILDKDEFSKSHLPQVAEAIKDDEDIPERIREMLVDALPKYLNEAKDPKVDPVEIDQLVPICKKWAGKHIGKDFSDSMDDCMEGIDTLIEWLKSRGFDPVNVRCDDPKCHAIHAMIPCQIPTDWANHPDEISVIAKDAFSKDGYSLALIDLEDLLSVVSGQLRIFLGFYYEMCKSFPQYKIDPDSVEFGGLRVQRDGEDMGLLVSTNILAVKEWINLQRVLHYRNGDGVWTKR